MCARNIIHTRDKKFNIVMLLGIAGEIAKQHLNKGIICTGITECIACVSRFTCTGSRLVTFDYEWKILSRLKDNMLA